MMSERAMEKLKGRKTKPASYLLDMNLMGDYWWAIASGLLHSMTGYCFSTMQAPSTTLILLQGVVRQALLPRNWQHQHSVRPVLPYFLWLTQHWDSARLLLQGCPGKPTIGSNMHSGPSMCCRYAMREALAIVAEEGLDTMWKRHTKLAKQLWQGLAELGLEPFVTVAEDRQALHDTHEERNTASSRACSMQSHPQMQAPGPQIAVQQTAFGVCQANLFL